MFENKNENKGGSMCSPFNAAEYRVWHPGSIDYTNLDRCATVFPLVNKASLKIVDR